MLSRLLTEMKSLPPLHAAPAPAESVAVTLLIPAKNSAHALETTAREAHRYLSRRFAEDFEILLVPTPSPGDPTLEVAEKLAQSLSRVRTVPHRGVVGKGAAIRTGYAASRGKWIFFTDADLPYDLDFFDEARARLAEGFDFVTGNRRLPTSCFDVPVGLLSVAYGRHRLGLGFNRVVRWLLPIRTTDTQAGIKALSRRLADHAFAAQRCPGFFFDLELFLAARGRGYLHAELPVTLYLNSEKSTVHVLRESVLAGFWLARIAWRNRVKAAYGRAPRAARPPAHYRGIAASTRFFLEARWRLTPYGQMAAKLPLQGSILDLGCGHGLLSLAISQGAPGRQVVGIDHDEERIRLARAAAGAAGIGNVRFETGGLPTDDRRGAGKAPENAGTHAGITLIDVMHYFDADTQLRILRNAAELLSAGGTLLVREVDPDGGTIAAWNRLYERLATASGFTRSEKKTELHFRTPPEWAALLRSVGFEVQYERCSSRLFSDILFVARKPGPAERGQL